MFTRCRATCPRQTTLLKTVLGQMSPIAGHARLGASLRIGYWAQSREDLHPEHTVLDEIMSVQDMTVGEARDLMARFLFTGDDVFKQVGDLSGGEQCRVTLAKLTLGAPNFLVLAEPTNQLDIPSQEIVESVLREGQHLTRDLGGTSGTTEIAEAIVGHVERRANAAS